MKANGIGLLIRSERVKRNWSQTDLAIHADMSLNAIHRIERMGRMSSRSAGKIAHALGLKPSALEPSQPRP